MPQLRPDLLPFFDSDSMHAAALPEEFEEFFFLYYLARPAPVGRQTDTGRGWNTAREKAYDAVHRLYSPQRGLQGPRKVE